MDSQLESDLKALRELFSVDGTKTNGAWARDSGGKSVTADNPDACCWCLIGGVRKVLGLPFPSFGGDDIAYARYKAVCLRLNTQRLGSVTFNPIWPDYGLVTFSDLS